MFKEDIVFRKMIIVLILAAIGVLVTTIIVLHEDGAELPAYPMLQDGSEAQIKAREDFYEMMEVAR